MKSHVFLTLSAGLTQVLAAPYIERPTRELTGHETVTATASAEFHVDGLPGLPKPVFSTHTHHAHGTETAAVTVPTGGYGASTTATESIVTEVETDTKTVTIAASADAITASGFTNSSVAVPKTTITVTPVFVTVSANHTSHSSTYHSSTYHSSTYGEVPSNPARVRGLQVEQAAPEKQYTTLTFTFDTMATTYTLLLPNGADATDTPAPVIRPTRSYPLAPPSGTWTEWNSMVTSTIPVVRRRSAPSSPVSPVETSVSIAPGYHVLPIPAPAPNPLEEAALSVTTPAPSLPRPKEQVRTTTILNGGEGAVERISKVGKGVQAGKHIDHEGVHAGKQNDVNDDEPESTHDLSWYFTASYTDDSVSLTMQPCYYDWQCWPEPSSSNTETFLPGVDGGKMAAATQHV